MFDCIFSDLPSSDESTILELSDTADDNLLPIRNFLSEILLHDLNAPRPKTLLIPNFKSGSF